MNRWTLFLAAVLWLAGSASASAQGLSGLSTQGGVTNDPSPHGTLGVLPNALRLPQGAPSLSPKELAAQCSSCHSADGVLQQFLRSKGESHAVAPPLTGLPTDEIVAQVNAFRGDESQAATMHRVLKQYTERQIREVASYVSSQPAVR